MFTIKNVSYKDILKIKELQLAKGSIISLFGESGSGKTTLLKMLNGMITPQSGEITYKGQQISELNPIELRKEVVMLGQDPVVFEGTIRENLLIGLEYADKELVEDDILKDLMDQLYLSKSLDEDAAELSGGEKQRLAFGRIMLMDAEVYLLDEPTSALDKETETAVMEFFTNKIKELKKTSVMVTHAKEIAEQYSDEIIYMKDILAKAGEKDE